MIRTAEELQEGIKALEDEIDDRQRQMGEHPAAELWWADDYTPGGKTTILMPIEDVQEATIRLVLIGRTVPLRVKVGERVDFPKTREGSPRRREDERGMRRLGVLHHGDTIESLGRAAANGRREKAKIVVAFKERHSRHLEKEVLWEMEE